MRVWFTCLVFVAFLVCLTSARRSCRNDTDCRCGHVCIQKGVVACSGDGPKCRCKRGCWLADVFFRPGETKTVYCNTCTCNVDRKQFQGSTLPCTRRAWCNLPTSVPLYPTKPACPADSLRR